MLEFLIVGLVVLVAVEILSERDPFACRFADRRLSDEELAQASLAFLRGEQGDNAVTPRAVPEGFNASDVETPGGDTRFTVNVTRGGDGPGGILKPHRFWPVRQAFGARLAVEVTLPGDTPDAPTLRILHVSDPCGTVLEDWSQTSSGRGGELPGTKTE